MQYNWEENYVEWFGSTLLFSSSTYYYSVVD